MSADGPDGGEDVADFLARIKELGDKRQHEDEERSRKLEQEILQGRKEREARRAERARSISPTKDSPLSSSLASAPQPADSPLSRHAKASSSDLAPLDLGRGSRDSRDTTPLAEPVKPNPPPSSAGGLASSGTLSWQQRPGSRESPTVRSRPLSTVAAENAMRSPSATPEPSSAETDRMSMSQRAQALEGKDPSWFRQTADRGEGSAAYRRSTESPVPQRRSDNVRLPGMPRGQSIDADAGSDAATAGSRARSPTHAGSAAGSADTNPRAAIVSGHSSFASPPPLLPKRNSDSSATGSQSPSRSPAMSPAQGRISPDKDRPVSPTKGLGGFVQSAMMKRSDSVTKRFSAQPVGGLSRGDSISRRAAAKPDATDGSASPTKEDDDGFVKPVLPHRHSQSGEAETSETQRPQTPVGGHSRSDSRRWSPTKSSWLEAAINKTEPPKPKPAVSQQPGWMADLNKAKQNRGSVDLGKAKAHGEVPVGGLLRSPAMGGPAKSPIVPTSTKPTLHSAKPSLTEEPAQLADDPNDGGEGEQGGSKGPTDPTDPKSASPASPKPKPEAPAKKDFRSNLKPRQPPPTSGQGGQPEFKNVFGKLRPTATKNFVAEDKFKSNILQGKSALNVTGGPRPWQKKDEFKDSILDKKKQMREGTSAVNTGQINEAKDSGVPEALAKRQNMSSKPVAQAPPQAKEIPEALAKRQNMPRPGSITSRTSQSSTVAAISAKPADRSSTSTESQPKESKLEGQSSEETKPGQETPKPGPQAEDSPTRPNPSRGASSSSSSSSKLADRFNPALAGILARGPPGSGAASPSRDRASSGSKPSDTAKQPSGPLSHQTKGRARGPKRRAPKQASADSKSEPSRAPREEATAAEKQPIIEEHPQSHDGATEDKPETKPKPYANRTAGGMSSIAASVASSAKVRSEGQASSPSPVKRATPAKLDVLSGSKQPADDSTKSQPSSPELGKKPAPSPKSPPPPGKKPDTLTRTPSIPQSPTATRSASVKSESKPAPSPKPSSPKASFSDKKPTPPAKPASPELSRTPSAGLKPPTPAKPSAKPVVAAAAAAEVRPQPPPKPKGNYTQAHQVLNKFFKQPLKTAADSKANADTQAILQKSPTPDKIKTLRKEIWEVTGDGKKISMPSDQSHVLFENSMFLCSHVFGAASGKRTTEVYLWCGSGVSSSAVEDAQLFCRNAARDAGGKLVIVEQGKEPSNFFEALGGIVITRMGAPATANSSRYMLCGRRHMGHIAFDEVAFSPQALCSGFPHIVAAADGARVYLWKGRGSATDELGCARLIAMDLGVSGDIEEVDEGAEPAAFWKAFGGGAPRKGPADGSWDKKAAAGEKYATRLFAVDLDARPPSSESGFMSWARRASGTPGPEEGGEQVREMAPYTQEDVAADGVFVLDSFFELFVVVGASAAQKLPSLHAALLFAQEYGVLAASLEDRPFIPPGTVVLGGSPQGLKTAFRRWRDNACATARAESVLGLNEALAAFEEE